MRSSRYARVKNAKKAFRVLFQLVILLALAALAVKTLILTPRYEPAESRRKQAEPALTAIADNSGQGGFVALSYFGVSDEGTETLISQKRLRQHLQALRDAGYVTIQQQDIIEYLAGEKTLPEKALFLFVEDGRRESAVRMQPILEECNFKASILTYANNLESRGLMFLSAQDLKALLDNSYWELGTNGYRLSYINMFDRHKNYLGELTPEEYVSISPYVRREYNHFLMDFLRDAYDIPMETPQQMQERVAGDYLLTRSAYEAKIGFLPGMYALMHSNTNQFATESKCSVENERWINQIFVMNFNREMYCYNDMTANIYDLTRMQPQAYWSVNHLLMRIRDDAHVMIPFEVGDEEKAAKWTLLHGAAEHSEDMIYVTSESEGLGVVRLNGSERYGDFYLSAYLKGNKLGTQSVDLLTSPDGNSCIAVEIENNVLRIYSKAEGGEPRVEDEGENIWAAGEVGGIMLTLDLDEHDGVVYQTWEENRQEAMAVEIVAKQAQKYRADQSALIAQDLARAKANLSNVNNTPYIPEISLKDAGERFVEITVRGGALYVSIDGKTAAENIPIGEEYCGIALRSSWGEYGYSQRNLADDVYDGVFQSLYITRLIGSDPDPDAILFDNRLEETSYYLREAEQVWKTLVHWVGAIF